MKTELHPHAPVAPIVPRCQYIQTAHPLTVSFWRSVAALFAVAAATMAQVSPPAASNAGENAAVELSPFEVRAERDDSYGALNSTSITSFNTELGKLPISADILTKTFFDDTGFTSVQQLIETFSAGAGFGSDRQDPGSIAAAAGPLDRRAGTTLRGLANTTYKRDGFMAPQNIGVGITNSFDLERVEVIKGPQSLLYGNGGAGGVVNVISKQARFGRPDSITVRHKVNRYGNQTGEIDLGLARGPLAARVTLLHEEIGGRRLNVGGPLDGAYAQLAYKLLGHTTVRLSGTMTRFDRIHSTNLLLNAGGAARDGRHGLRLKYLLATNQLDESATGSSGAGTIANGRLDWENVDSYSGNMTKEYTTAEFAQLTADTQWNDWLTSQVAVGYKHMANDFFAPSVSFFSPNNPSNPLGQVWALALTTRGPIDSWQPSREKAVRLSAVARNRLFGGRATSQSMLGGDYFSSSTAAIQYRYYRADENWNPIYNPAIAVDNGRTPLNQVAWSIDNGPVKYPLWKPGADQVVYEGQRYIRMVANPADPALASTSNPLGVTLNGHQHQISTAKSHGLFGVNYIQWLDGRLNTLAGFRLMSSDARTRNHIGTNSVQKAENFSFNVGADYNIAPWLHPYFSISDSYNPPNIVLNDPHGRGPKLAHALGGEFGLKLGNPSGSVSGQVAFYSVKSTDESYLAVRSLVDLINPVGLNGRFGAPDQYLTVDRRSKGAELTLTAAPTRSWRMRLGAAWVKGTVGTATEYEMLYNDEFHQNAAGEVTYRDGTRVYVQPTFSAARPVVPSGTPGAIPLTIAMMNTPGSPYYANPRPVSGAISGGSNVARVLQVVDPVHGPILTGAVGLPISRLQIDPGFAPPASIETSRIGERTTGNPEFSVSFTNSYTVPQGRLKGVRVGGTVLLSWRNTNYYYYTAPAGPGVPRELFYRPDVRRFDVLIGYEHKFGRITWSTQLNIFNTFNTYKVMILPDPVAGYGGSNRNAVFDREPRSFLWTNTFRY